MNKVIHYAKIKNFLKSPKMPKVEICCFVGYFNKSTNYYAMDEFRAYKRYNRDSGESM